MKKMRIIVAVIAACLLAGCANQVKDGAEQLKEKDYKGAIATYQKAIDKEKDMGEAYLGQGMAYYELEDYKACKEALTNALSNDVEKTPIIYNMMGICDMNLDNVDGAMGNFNMGVTMAEDSSSDTDYAEVAQEMEYNLIVCYEKKADWASAKTKMAAYIAKYPEDADAQREAQFLETR